MVTNHLFFITGIHRFKQKSMEKKELKFEKEFREWLSDNNVTAAQDNYISRMKSIEAKFGSTIDNINNFIESKCDEINVNNFTVTDGVLSDYRTALRAYWKFIQATNVRDAVPAE